MTNEVELKSRIGSIEKMEQKLEKLGAKFKSEFDHIDTYFGMKWEVGSRSILKKKKGRVDILLRMRQDIRTDGIKHIFTMRTSLSDDSAVREKISIEIGDPEKMQEVLKAMKVVRVLTLHKKRKCFELDGKEILLDRISEIGNWIEVAKEKVPEGSIRKTKKELERFMKNELGLEDIESREYFRIAVEEIL